MKITADDKETINPAYTTWLNNDGLLTLWLLGTIAEEIFIDLDDTHTTYQVWKSIEDKFLPSSKEKEVLLIDTLMTLPKGNVSLGEFLWKFKRICDNLAANNKPLDKTHKVLHLARGLGSKYKDF